MMSNTRIKPIYKIETKEIWDKALATGIYHGAPIDVADGYIHFSTSSQTRETVAKHFAGRDGLIIAAFDAAAFGTALKWEKSRGDAMFPHLYDKLDMSLVLATYNLPLNDEGLHIFPDEIL